MKKIIICAPAEATTGGPELAHQLCSELNSYNEYDAQMFYYGKGEKNIPKPYKKYNVKVANNIPNNKNIIVVVPETAIQLFSKYKKVKKVIWWMSVDNYFTADKSIINKIKKIMCVYVDYKRLKNVYHLVQSQYAKMFLLDSGINESQIYHVSDYLNALFIKKAENDSNKEKRDVVLYNPKKGYETTKKIIEYNNDITFLPLVNLTREEMIELLSTSKLYIDFGNHPGKDRIPREAAISGCCIITGKRGAAKYYQDVAIDDKYKFDDDNINMEELRKAILNVFDNYKDEREFFIDYCNKIKNEEKNFKDEVKNAFTKIVEG